MNKNKLQVSEEIVYFKTVDIILNQLRTSANYSNDQ